MNKRYLVFAALFALVALLLLGASLYYRNYVSFANQRGQYTFAQTRQNISRMARIQMITADDGEINIIRDGGLWRLREAAGYYINNAMLAAFYQMVNNSVIMTVQKSDTAQIAALQLAAPTDDAELAAKGTEVAVYDDEGVLLDHLIISKPLKDSDYRYARHTGSPYVYTISSAGIFAGDGQSWVPYPLLKISDDMIDALIIDGKILDRQLLHDIEPYLSFIRDIKQTLGFVRYDGIALQSDFFAAFPDIKPQTLQVLTPVGLLYTLDVYAADNAFWLTVKLERGKLSSRQVAEFIRDNQHYFDGWIFKLEQAQGQALYDSKIGQTPAAE